MQDTIRICELDDFDHRLAVACINMARNMLIEKGEPIEDVSLLMQRIIKAPTKKQKRKADREAR